jgi:cyclase
VAEAVNIPVIASGGAGNIEHIYEALTEGKAEAALVASIVHYGKYSIRQIKEELLERASKCVYKIYRMVRIRQGEFGTAVSSH